MLKDRSILRLSHWWLKREGGTREMLGGDEH